MGNCQFVTFFNVKGISWTVVKNDKPMAMRQIEIAVEKGYNSWSTLRDFPFLKNMHGYKPYDDFILARIK